MKIVCISDTHNYHDFVHLPEGDLLIHAGDMCMIGDEEEMRPVCDWLATLPYENVIVIAGNHDLGLANDPDFYEKMFLPHVTYLKDSGVTINGVKFWGSPWQPHYPDWGFYAKGDAIREKWSMIPNDTDVLITHTPMYDMLDLSNFEWDEWPPNTLVGCRDLRKRVDQIRPKLHVCGHIHEARGIVRQDGSIFVNASICDRNYDSDHIQPPIVVEI